MTAKKITSLELAKAAREALLNKKGSDIVILDVRGISDVTDFYVLCTGNNSPHIKALWHECEVVMHNQRGRAYRHAGKPESGWLVGDYWDVVVHVFTESARQAYALENLWRDAKIVE
jgi:ribosome-associated protein